MAVDMILGKSAATVAYAEQPPQQAPHSYASDKSYRFTIVFAAREPIRKVVVETTIIIIVTMVGL